MSFFSKCHCRKSEALVNITNDYAGFVGTLLSLEAADWVKLMECPTCKQLWRVDEWDKYQALYALKISDRMAWKEVDAIALIKEKMIKSRGGLAKAECMWQSCANKAVMGSAYCVDHLYETGARS